MHKSISRAGGLLSASTSLSRPFSSSSSSAFLFRRPAPPTSQVLLRELLDARKAERPDLVAKLYPTFVESLAKEQLKPSDQNSLTAIMKFVGQTDRFPLLLRMFNDLPKFGFQPTTRDHRILLRGLVKAGQLSQALNWLDSMEQSYGVSPKVREWNVVLDGFRGTEDMNGLYATFARMKSQGIVPDVTTYNTMIQGAFKSGDLDEVRRLTSEMVVMEVKGDLWTDTTLLSGFLDAREIGSATAIRRRLEPLLERWLANGPIEGYDVAVVNAFIKHESVVNGLQSGIDLASKVSQAGLPCDRWTLNTLLKVGAEQGLAYAQEGIERLEKLERVTGVTSDAMAWTLVLKSLLAGSGGLNEALKVYQEARDRSVQIDSQMLQPLLSELLLPSPTPETFAIAKSLYEDISGSSKSHRSSPDLSIYNTLLRACADPSAPDLEFSRSLISDMRQRGIHLNSGSVAWLIIAHIRVARNYEEAFQAYDSLRSSHVSDLNIISYNNILATFTSLSFPSSSTGTSSGVPRTFVQEFLTDMRRTGHPPNATTYAIFFEHYSRTGSVSAPAISHIHSLLKVDGNLDPDTSLLNTLMNAYSRAKAFNAALGVWDSMRANKASSSFGRIDDASVSIVFDTLGWLGRQNGHKRAHALWKELKKERYPLNLNHYNSWVECLCRMDDLEEAERVVFEEMAIGEPVEAAATTVEILLRFSKKIGGAEKAEDIWARAEKERPDLRRELENVPNRLKPSASDVNT